MSSSLPQLCPMPYRYGVIRMDTVAMVEHLNDPVALKEAQSLQTKKYLVYIEEGVGLPLPDQPWYRFSVSPIATELRHHDDKLGFTRPMCVPIYPNTAHPKNRAPIHTLPEFPLSGCYHWLSSGIDVRIRAKPESEGFDDTRAIRLPPAGRVSLAYHWSHDNHIQMKLLRRRGDQTAQPATLERDEQPLLGRPESFERLGVANHSDSESEGILVRQASIHTDDVSSTYSSDRSESPAATDDSCSNCAASDGSSGSTSTGSGVLADMDVLGEHNPESAAELIPLVDFTFELDELLNAGTIPSPVELWEECDIITRIIKESRARKGSAHRAAVPDRSSIVEDFRSGMILGATIASKRRRLRPVKAIRKARTQAEKFMRTMHDALRLPYIVCWP